MSASKSSKPLLLTLVGVAVLAAAIAGLAIPLYAPTTSTKSTSSQVGATLSQSPSSSGSLLTL